MLSCSILNNLYINSDLNKVDYAKYFFESNNIIGYVTRYKYLVFNYQILKAIYNY